LFGWVPPQLVAYMATFDTLSLKFIIVSYLCSLVCYAENE